MRWGLSLVRGGFLLLRRGVGAAAGVLDEAVTLAQLREPVLELTR